MADWKCPDCGAQMIRIDNRDGSSTQHCEYCGKNIHVQPQNLSGQLGSLLNRAVNAVADRLDPIAKHEAFIEDLKRLRDQADGKKRMRLEKQIANEERALEAYKRARRR